MYIDSEAKGMMDIAAHLTAAQMGVWPKVKAMIMGRCQMLESGVMQAPRWMVQRLAEVDPLLNLRWDFFEGCWVVDRFTQVEGCWTPVCVWKDENGAKQLDLSLIETLQDGDMWRFANYKEYLAYKREKARKQRERNRKAGEEKILAAFDKLSSRDLNEFVEVGQALKTGETIECHGNDAGYFQRYNEGAKAAIAADYHKNRRV
jgi:hypothetical protein